MDSLLPSSANEFERSLEWVCSRLERVEIPIREMWRPGVCPTRLLPWLANSVGVDRWPCRFSEDQKREAISGSIGVYRTKGTIGALRRVLAVEGVECDVDEGVGGAFTFGIDFRKADGDFGDGDGADVRDRIDELVGAVRGAKNLRSHLVSVNVHHGWDVGVRVGMSVSVESHVGVLFEEWRDSGDVGAYGGSVSVTRQGGKEFAGLGV